MAKVNIACDGTVKIPSAAREPIPRKSEDRLFHKFPESDSNRSEMALEIDDTSRDQSIKHHPQRRRDRGGNAGLEKQFRR